MWLNILLGIVLSVTFFSAVFLMSAVLVNRTPSVKAPHPAYSVLLVRDEEDTIEHTIRTLAEEISKYSPSARLVVLDLHSKDNTLLILRKLAREFTFIYPMKTEDYCRLISKLN